MTFQEPPWSTLREEQRDKKQHMNSVYMRNEDEGRKKQARSNKQQGKATQYIHIQAHVHVAQLVERSVQSVECRGFEAHPRQLIFLGKSDCLGCAVLLCFVVRLILLASFFLLSHLSLKHVHVCMSTVLGRERKRGREEGRKGGEMRARVQRFA